jgi:hypothetical protein
VICSEKYINANKVSGAKSEKKSHLEDLDKNGGIMLFIFYILLTMHHAMILGK